MPLKPVFMLHSILEEPAWAYDFLATRQEELMRLIRFHRRLGFRFIKARDWPNADRNSVCLTFDDGYLDNWTLLFPLLEKEGIPFTIFICKDFVEDSDEIRPFGLMQAGFLSRAELKELNNSELVDIQSHSVTHTWYPTSPELVDLFDSGRKQEYPWLLWNRDPACKPHWLDADYSSLHGCPVLENDRSLRACRFLLDEDLWESFSEKVMHEGLDLVEARQLQDSLPPMGRHETGAERSVRYIAEIKDNNDYLQELLGYRPSILCWPGGAYNDHSVKVAEELGMVHTRNRGFGRLKTCMHRMSPVNPYGRETFPWKYQNLTLAYYLLRFGWGYLRRIDND